MKVGKKLLSVFLAVIMIMSSMSVCFGCVTFASAADETDKVDAFVAAMQCDAMKRFNPTTGDASNATSITYIYNAQSYADYEAISNVISKLDAAIKGLDEYKNGATHNSNKNCSDGWVNSSTYIVPENKKNECTDTGYLLKYLENAIGTARLETIKGFNFEKLSKAVFSTHDCQYRNADGNQDDIAGDIAASSVPDVLTNVLIVKTDKINEKLTGYASVSAIPDTLEVQTSYTIKMFEQNWTTTEWTWTGKKTINHRHIAINTNKDGGTPTVAKSSTSTNKSALVTAENTLKANAYYNAADVPAVLSLSSNNVETLKTAKKTLEDVKTAVNNDAVFNHFFGTKYDAAIKRIDEAIVVLGYKDTVDAINEYYSVDFMRMNKDEVKAHLDGFNAAYATFTGLSDSAQATIVSSYGLDTAAVEAKIQEAQNRYDYLCVIELKNEADGYIATYGNWTIDNVDDGSVTSAMLTVAAANLIRVIAGLEAYDAALITSVAGADYIKNLKALKQNIDKLGKAAGYNDRFLAEYAEFTARIEAVTSTNSATLFNALASYDSWYTDLKALISKMYSELGTTDAEKLFDDLNDTMVAHMDAAYKELNKRTEVQINVAYDLYDAHKAVYGATVHYVSLESYYILRNSIGLIDTKAYNFLNNSGNFTVPAETVKKYNELQNILPKYNEFVATKGFGTYETLEIDDITREKSDEEIFRDKDYTVTDELVLDIIDTLEAALADPEIKAILGKLINKETGEPFDIANLLSGLISDGLFSDSLINTIIQFLYPAVSNVFTEVWSGINPKIKDDNMNVAGDMYAAVDVDLSLVTVEKATEGLGVPLFPVELASKIRSGYSQFSAVADVLDDAKTLASISKDTEGNWDESTRKSPWNDAVLYTEVTNDKGEVQYDDEGNAKTKLNLNWGIDELEGDAKRERFLQAIQAALSGVEPLLLALLCNKSMAQFNPAIGTGLGDLSGLEVYIEIAFGRGITLTINGATIRVHTINLELNATANDGYNNVIAPLFELLGVTAPNGNTFNSTRDVIEKGLLEPLDAVIAKLAANPIETILEILPNLAYAIEADLLLTKLEYLNTQIEYSASAVLNLDLNTAEGVGKYLKYVDSIVSDKTGYNCQGGVLTNVPLDNVVANDGLNGHEPPLDVALSSFLDINALLGEGVDLSSFAGIWNLVSGLLGEDLELPAPNAAYIATLGTLTEIDTVRSIKSYNWGTPGKAAHIVANKADVLIYLVKYALESGLLGALVANPNELVDTLFTNLATNSEDAIAAIAELLNQETVYNAKKYSWFNGSVNGSSVVGNSAMEIYLNPGNDWTKEKANYLYNNLDAIVAQILTLAKVDLDKTTEDVDGSLGEVIGGAIGGLLSDKTLTALAGALGKLDLNALLAPKADAEAGEGEDEEEAEAEASAIDVNALIKEFLGVDLGAFTAENSIYATVAAELEADEKAVHNFGVDAGTSTFAAELVKLLEPLGKVLDFILADENLTITINGETVTLLGAEGYNNGLLPLLEALGIDAVAAKDKTGAQILEYVVNALVARINTLTTGDVIKNIVDLLPGVFYFITSNGLSTTVLNLLQPVVVILDTIRPIVDVMAIINNLEVGEEGAKKPLSELLGGPINLERLDLGFIFGLLPALVPAIADLDLSGLVNVIYDICNNVGVEYTSKAAVANTVETTVDGATVKMAKKGALGKDFDGADLLTVVLSFVLEWATIKDNAKALDELLKTNGLIENIGKVFADVDISYGTPTWYYWFDSEDAFNAYIEGDTDLPNTLAALTYPNDWNEETAQYIADKLPELVDMVIALINKDKGEDAPKTLAALLNNLVYGDFNITVQEADAEKGTEAVVINYLFSDETINALLGLLKGILANVDDALLGAGYILDVDVVGLKSYTCDKDITTIDAFFAELAYVLDTYAKGLVDLLFFGDDFRIAKKSDKTDTIVINGGLGYEKGLALILEALGCDAPAAADATVYNVLGSLATRVKAILAKPVEEVIDLLPNLVYFLNADGASVAVNNLLAPVYALLNKINSLGLLEKEINLAELLGFDLKYLSLADILALVKDKTGLDLSAAEEILVNLCIGKIEKATYTYKMTADRADTITVILTTALMLVSDDDFAAKLDKMLGTEIISAIKTVFESTPVKYGTPNWDYCWDKTDVDYVEGTIGVIESALTYPNDWSEAKAQYLADNLGNIVNTVVAMIDINGTKYESLADLIDANVNIYTPDLLKMIQKALGDLIGGLDEDIQALVNVGLGAADKLLGADVQGLLEYDVSGVNDKETFVAALTGMLMEVEGLVDWLLLGEDYKLFFNGEIVKDEDGEIVKDEDGKIQVTGNDIITLNGGHGYAEGLALVLEALGCQNLPTVYDVEGEIDTEAVVSGVLTSLANRIDAVLADPINEAIDLLPNLIYFLNTNGVAVAVDNLLGAFNALAVKLAGFGLNLNLNDLINIQKLMKIEGQGATISLDNLAMKDILQAVSLMFGFDLTVLEGTLNGFALGEVADYESVSRTDFTFKMGYKDEFDKHDMITVLVTAILNVATAEGNEEAIKALLGENAGIYNTILKLISGAEISYSTPKWNYCWDENGQATGETIPVIKSALTYPNDWNKEAVQYLTENLPALVDEVVKMVTKDDEASLSKLLTDNVNVFNADTLNSLVKTINELLSGIDAGLIEAAGILLDVKLVGENSLATYVAPKEVDTVEEFAAELAYVLTTYAGGVVEWLLLGDSYTFFVNDDGDGKYTAGEDVITIKGAHGYAEGLALLLEALGCENLPEVYDVENLDTTAVVNGVLNSLAARITEIFANPVKEVIDLLPNLLYFLNANGVAAVVDNLTAALTALLNELTVFGINLDINSLINIPKLMGIADKYAEGDDVISLDNLTLKAILKAVSLMTGLDLTVLEAVLADFALGEVAEYDSVSAKPAYKMSYSDEFDKHHMVTVLLTSVLLAVFETEGNAEKLAEMLDTDIITAIEDVFNSTHVSYKSIDWDYIEKDDGGDYMLAYPNNWNKNTATAVAELLKDKEIEALIAGLIDENYDSFSALLNDKVNVFTTANLQAVVDLITNLLAGINDGLLKAAGLLLDVKVAELKAYKAPEGITTVDAFAAELANVLTTYANGVVEWLLLGKDYRFFVKDVKDGVPVDFITINGANGYTEGLALLLEALGVAAPAVIVKDDAVDTKATVEAVLKAVANRIDAIFANPVAEVIALLPNIIYFLNTDGVAVVINNTVAAVQAVLDKLVSILGKEIKITELVDLADLMGVADKYTDADKVIDEKTNKNLVIALDNITIKTLLKAVSYMIDGLDLTVIEDVLVGFNLGVVAPYTTVSATEAETAKKMTLADADTVTIIANLLLLTVKDTDNAEFLKGLVGEEIYNMIMSLFNLETKAPQDFDWLYKERLEDDDPENDIFSTLETSGVYDDWPLYGPHYTEEMATYIADNFGMFVDNILYLLGLEINGVQINDLTTLINELLDGSLYNSSNVIAIRDALAGVLASLADLEVNGKNVGKHIVAVLKAAKIANLEAVGKVEVAEFTESREKFVAAICDVLAPLYPVLKWLLADEDIAFFVDAEKKDLITLPGAEGYAFGIIPILEVLGCSMNEAEAKAKAEAKAEAMGVSVDKVKVSSWIIAPDAYYAMLDEDSVEYNPDILITSILDVLLDRVDEIIENPADEILGILPNLIYFINSNGLDTVFKNTLSAVYTILDAINPLVEIDLYKLIGIDLKKIDMNYLVELLLDLLADLEYNFKAEQLDPIAELTVGKLEKYTSVNGKTAYRMVYAPEVGAGGGSAELVTVILRLLVTFLMHEKNAEIVVEFLSDNLGMSPDAKTYLTRLINSIAKVPTTTYLGMDQALAVIYYLFYSADIGAGEVVGGFKDIGAEWKIVLKELGKSDDPNEQTIGNILAGLFEEDIVDENRFAPSGLIGFFKKLVDWFNMIIEWFKKLF